MPRRLAQTIINDNTNRFTEGLAVGGPGGGNFFFVSPRPEARVRDITVITSKDSRRSRVIVARIEVVFSDDTQVAFGAPPENVEETKTFRLLPGEVLTECTLGMQDNAVNGLAVLAWFGLATSSSRTFGVGNTSVTQVNVGSGELAGFAGGSGSVVDRLAPVFVDRPTSVQVVDVVYDIENGVIGEERLLAVATESFRNLSSIPVEHTFEFSELVGETSDWAHEIGVTAGVTTTIRTGVPNIAEGEIGLSLEASYSYSWGASLVREISLTESTALQVDPMTKATADLAVTEGTLDVPFTGTVVATYSDTTTSSFPTSGVYEGVSHHTLQVTLRELEPIGATPEAGVDGFIQLGFDGDAAAAAQ